ncbi:MAG TPA: cytochrome c oxidase subunit 3 family protein [Thermodesulfovibrionales bacterium]|nr:cytochrome c oxidase subunit 3 family protein [Thermodesulfovibrionales bacterium]
MEKTETAHAVHTRDIEGAKMGMWVFLFTEMLLFGGLFLLYSVYRSKYSAEFHGSAAELDIVLGTLNTVILLTSSLTMVLSISALRKGHRGLSSLFQGMTILLAIIFLVNKYLEWSTHIHHGIYPDSPALLAMERGQIIFFSLYYVMTGIHGLHVLIGAGVIAGTLVFTTQGKLGPDNFVMLENTGLYWHFVDIIWIYLFPLFYLIV